MDSSRRDFIRNAAVGSVIVGLGGLLYRVVGDDINREARAQKRGDGRARLPPGQRLIKALKPMGGEASDGGIANFRLRVHGAVGKPFTLDYAGLLKLPQVERATDVHCVTGWTVLDAVFKGVSIATLAEAAGVKATARHVIFEAAHFYTANVPLAEATAPSCMVTYRLNGKPLTREHGAPVRGLIPDLYFWKSAKWISGIRFVADDEPGYWETRGYHNHADPWKEERYS
ncbi:MAG: molybdopterin-dependent oxidoreductase [Myxococcales bacterium]|nr:molybdopterin-dependent oxidoreductase [Myxococcales bacterium]